MLAGMSAFVALSLFLQGLNGQKKYQIHLKSTSGPIDVLLVNKDAWSSPPVVLPVPPPEDLIQCQPVTPSKPHRPSVSHSQEASVPSSTHPSAPVPNSTQDRSLTVQKTVSTAGEPEGISSGFARQLENVMSLGLVRTALVAAVQQPSPAQPANHYPMLALCTSLSAVARLSFWRWGSRS